MIPIHIRVTLKLTALENACCVKCDPQKESVNVSKELVRNAEFQAVPQTC